MKKRIGWMDVAKCFGIFAIYWGHYGVADGRSCAFVFHYHVPLFFFLAGCLEAVIPRTGIRDTIRKTVTGLLIPWLLFCALSVVLYVLQSGCELREVWFMFRQILRGTLRGKFVAWGLWFLTALASTRLLFAVLKKLPGKAWTMAGCMVLFVIACLTLDEDNAVLPYNIDCAMYYILYYGIGYVAYPVIDALLNPKTIWQKVLSAAGLCYSAGYCVLLYFGRNLYDALDFLPFAGEVLPVLTALTAIWLNIAMAGIFRDVPALQSVGRNSLYLCGNEYIVRILSGVVCGSIGLNMSLLTVLDSFLMSLITLWAAGRFLIPVEKAILSKLFALPDWFRTNPEVK